MHNSLATIFKNASKHIASRLTSYTHSHLRSYTHTCIYADTPFIAAGLNCGMWDYSASFINKFGHRKDFILPDRMWVTGWLSTITPYHTLHSAYVDMTRHFLKSYMALVVQTCHKRKCIATVWLSYPSIMLTSWILYCWRVVQWFDARMRIDAYLMTALF